MIERYYIEYDIFKDQNGNDKIKLLALEHDINQNRIYEVVFCFSSPINQNKIDMDYLEFNFDNLTLGSKQVINVFYNVKSINDITELKDYYINSNMQDLIYLFSDEYRELKIYHDIQRELQKELYFYQVSIKHKQAFKKALYKLKLKYPNKRIRTKTENNKIIIY